MMDAICHAIPIPLCYVVDLHTKPDGMVCPQLWSINHKGIFKLVSAPVELVLVLILSSAQRHVAASIRLLRRKQHGLDVCGDLNTTCIIPVN